MGCNTGDIPEHVLRPPAVDEDYGEPVDKQAVCVETQPGSGIFTRDYTKAKVTMDCNTFHATIDMVGVDNAVGRVEVSAVAAQN